MSKKTRVARSLTALNIAFLAFGEIAFSSSSATTNAQSWEEPAALLQNSRTNEVAYLTGLEKATREEKRNEFWAAQKESALRKSFSAEEGLQNAVFKSVECYNSRCDLRFQVSLKEKDRTEQWTAINHWIATTQVCGYTMVPWPNPEQLSGEIRVFLNCGGR